MQAQPNSVYCFVCGLENVAGVRVRFCGGAATARAEGKFLTLPLSAISGPDADLPGWQVYSCKE